MIITYHKKNLDDYRWSIIIHFWNPSIPRQQGLTLVYHGRYYAVPTHPMLLRSRILVHCELYLLSCSTWDRMDSWITWISMPRAWYSMGCTWLHRALPSCTIVHKDRMDSEITILGTWYTVGRTNPSHGISMLQAWYIIGCIMLYQPVSYYMRTGWIVGLIC